MNCSCGGATAEASSRSGKNVLSFDRCRACGRQGGYRLRIGGLLVAVGVEARDQFNAIVDADDEASGAEVDHDSAS